MPRNNIPNIITNQAQNVLANLNGVRPTSNMGIPVARNMPNTITATPVAANVASFMPVTNTINGQIANSFANDQMANVQLANAINSNIMLAEPEVAAINNINIANVANDNLVAFAGNTANINGNNIATFNLGNAFTVTSGSPGNRAFGIQLLAEALEVGGTVAVNGQIPIFGTVALNGHLPTDGSASVSYSCGRSPAVITDA